MEKRKKKIAAKIAGLTAILTLASCCFLGTTFAKYVSSTSGEASVGVAYWQVDGISANSEEKVNFNFVADKMSPDHVDGEISWSATYDIANKSDVKAAISFELPALSYYTDAAATTAYAENVEYKDGATLTNAIIADVITVGYEYTVDSGATWKTLATGDVVTLEVGSTTPQAMSVKVTITWKTAAADGDAIDTAIGMYVKSAKAAISVTATQASTVTPSPVDPQA